MKSAFDILCKEMTLLIQIKINILKLKESLLIQETLCFYLFMFNLGDTLQVSSRRSSCYKELPPSSLEPHKLYFSF